MRSAQSWGELAGAGAGYLIDNWPGGFAEAAHVLAFPAAQGFDVDSDEQRGDVFQRALLTDVLADLNDAADGGLADLLRAETDYLLAVRRPDGWCYFPGLRELPADADDLGAVLLALLRAGRLADVAASCEEPVAVLLADNSYPDGSFETWIMPARNRRPEHDLQEKWINLAWGTGPDVEVMANLLYALSEYAPARFADPIRRGADYVESVQRSDGSWPTTWYVEPYYGTFVCARLLRRVRPRSRALARAEAFVVAGQRPDGGWGAPDAPSDPLATALALLTLRETGLVFQGAGLAIRGTGAEVVAAARDYLAATREGRLGWPAGPFIRMPLGRPFGTVWQVLHYGSRTITTGFVTKAALAGSSPAERADLTSKIRAARRS
jgi:squalene-hopene/tetraprenyl-beta-curcumene cyclase